jgi:hypothetical protein
MKTLIRAQGIACINGTSANNMLKLMFCCASVDFSEIVNKNVFICIERATDGGHQGYFIA